MTSRYLFVVDVKQRSINNTPYDVYRFASGLPPGSVEVIDLRFTPLDAVTEADETWLFLETAGTWMCFDWNPARFLGRLEYLLRRCRSLTIVGPQAPALRELSGRRLATVDTLDYASGMPADSGWQPRPTGDAWLDRARNASYNGQHVAAGRMCLA